MLLLPEQNSDIVMQRIDYNTCDDALDPRPICIQTKNNFSHFSQHNNLEEDYIISRFNSNLSSNGTALLDDKTIAISQKDFSLEVTPVWAAKHISPVRITDPQKQIFIPKE